jgi:fructokinase
MKTIICIGELLIDFVAENQGNDLSKASIFTKKAGGAPANVACAIAKLGGLSSFIGCVGVDPFGTFLLQVLQDAGVQIEHAQRSEIFTTLAYVSLAENGERDFVFSRGADRELKYDTALKSSFSNNIVHFGAATALLGGPLEDAYSRYFFDALTQKAFISFDPNYRADLWKNNQDQFIKKCMPFIQKSHLCKFSLEEALLLSGEENLKEACTALHNIGVNLITVTLGAEGTLVSTPTLSQTVPSISVIPVDTTGAGDAFIGCLLYQMAALPNLDDALHNIDTLMSLVQKANIAGAITTTNFGAIESLPNLEQLDG